MASPMVSLELDDEDQYDYPTPIAMEKPDFPPGMRISLTQQVFDKLDLDPSLAKPGAIFHGHFMARIEHVSIGTDHCCIEAQIVAMQIEDDE